MVMISYKIVTLAIICILQASFSLAVALSCCRRVLKVENDITALMSLAPRFQPLQTHTVSLIHANVYPTEYDAKTYHIAGHV